MANTLIFEQLKALNVPMDSHESDLYVKVTPETRKIIAAYEHKENVTTFKSNTDGSLWFDIPFAYKPWWTRRGCTA